MSLKVAEGGALKPEPWLFAPLRNIVLKGQVLDQADAIRTWAKNELDGYRYRAEELTEEDRAHIHSPSHSLKRSSPLPSRRPWSLFRNGSASRIKPLMEWPTPKTLNG